MHQSFRANRQQIAAELAAELAALNRHQLVPRLLDFPSPTQLDFTEDYLDHLTTDQLRHILLAAMLYLRPR